MTLKRLGGVSSVEQVGCLAPMQEADPELDVSAAERLRQILDGAIDHAIIETDLDRCVRGWNKGAERLFGYDTQVMLGEPADVSSRPRTGPPISRRVKLGRL